MSKYPTADQIEKWTEETGLKRRDLDSIFNVGYSTFTLIITKKKRLQKGRFRDRLMTAMNSDIDWKALSGRETDLKPEKHRWGVNARGRIYGIALIDFLLWRLHCPLKIEAVAELVDCSAKTVSQWERWLTIPSPSCRDKLAKFIAAGSTALSKLVTPEAPPAEPFTKPLDEIGVKLRRVKDLHRTIKELVGEQDAAVRELEKVVSGARRQASAQIQATA